MSELEICQSQLIVYQLICGIVEDDETFTHNDVRVLISFYLSENPVFTVADLKQKLGISIRTLNRTVTRLAFHGLLRREEGEVYPTDLEALQAFRMRVKASKPSNLISA